jgi:hypothetical protein
MQQKGMQLFLVALCFSTAMLAQTKDSKPDPALQKLSVFDGQWTYEGQSKSGPHGSTGKVSGEEEYKMMPGGASQEHRLKQKGPAGETQLVEVNSYDPKNKNFTYHMSESDGDLSSGVMTQKGNTWTWRGKVVIKGKQYPSRGTYVFAPDRKSYTVKSEYSPDDGQTWKVLYEGKNTKVEPATKIKN